MWLDLIFDYFFQRAYEFTYSVRIRQIYRSDLIVAHTLIRKIVVVVE